MHGVSAYGLLVQTGRHPVGLRRTLWIAAVAAIVVVGVIDFDVAPAQASGNVVTTRVSPPAEAAPVALAPDAAWAADESRRGTRPDAAH